MLETSSLSSSDSVLPPHPPPPDFFFASLPVLIPCKNLPTAAFNTAVRLGSNRQLNLCPRWSCSVQAAQVSEWVLRPGVGPAVLWREGCKSATCLTNRKFLSFRLFHLLPFFQGADVDCHSSRLIPSLLNFCLASKKTAAAVSYCLEDYRMGLLPAP